MTSMLKKYRVQHLAPTVNRTYYVVARNAHEAWMRAELCVVGHLRAGEDVLIDEKKGTFWETATFPVGCSSPYSTKSCSCGAHVADGEEYYCHQVLVPVKSLSDFRRFRLLFNAVD